jgi:hypothetical protein
MTGYHNLLRFCFAASLVFGLSASARAADPNGTWKWKIDARGQEIEFTMVLKAEGEKLTGNVSLPFGDAGNAEIKNGTFKNDEVSFETVLEFGGNSITTKYKGKVEGDTIKGKTERERQGQVMSQDWTAMREKK